ncbi:MAG: hypothetical protein A2000_15980 [Ignavibacteria bacterium GWB2_36_8]|nr:MAG: hypothetical protein A2000_15980 [Ignavibacteria bacterium GWB2_36_8]OGU51339.1 MAG: hypothetical protein A2080_10785 [Ignavibacteria bacterium GWC2_36_12]
MKAFSKKVLANCLFVVLIILLSNLSLAKDKNTIHVWEMMEIKLTAEKAYNNYYMDVTCWLDLKGPGFSKRIYGFWNGGNDFIVRIVASKPGKWEWESNSNHPEDEGLNYKSGSLMAIEWTEKEKIENPNRRGFLRPTSNGHALQYADGTPFFMIGDTWLAGSTWRLPFRNAETSDNYIPGPGIGFEDAVMFRKKQGFNSVSMISCFPNWESDIYPGTYADSNNIYLRNAWEKFGYDVRDTKGIDTSGYWGSFTAKNMRDEYGNLPFEMSKNHKGVSDFTRINPEYFKSLDKKMEFLSDKGFVSLLETVRRDVGPSWKTYFNFKETFSRFVQYLVSRYGADNIIFSGIHLDWIPKDFSLTAEEFNEALTYHLEKYGPMPFGQPVTTLISSSTYTVFGHNKDCPWLTMHSVGNKPRDHRISDSLEVIFRLTLPYSAINFEPYYTGWNHEINKPNGERPPANSERDNYFSRAQMYGSVLSGGLSGHVHGTAAYDITTTGEPEGSRPHVWDAFMYESADYMKHLETFVLSEGEKYQYLLLAREDVIPDKAPGSPPEGLDGWAYMMRTSEKDFALLYFENQSVVPVIKNFIPGKEYYFQWFDTITGKWDKKNKIKAGSEGTLIIPSFPDEGKVSSRDWAAKIILE